MSRPILGATLPSFRVEVDGWVSVVDTGDFFTMEHDPVTWRALTIRGPLNFYAAPPSRTRLDDAFAGRGTRDQFAVYRIKLAPGTYTFTTWGGHQTVDAGTDYIEWGNDDFPNGGERKAVATVTVPEVGPPPPGPLDELREGVAQLKGSVAYRAGFVNVRRGTDKCADALTRLGG